MRLEIEAEVFPEGSFIVAHAKALDVSSCGTTADEAVRALLEAVRLFVTTALEMGTFEQILIESGYVRQGDEWIVPKPAETWSSVTILPAKNATRRLACVEI
jgi:hypothetical protein